MKTRSILLLTLAAAGALALALFLTRARSGTPASQPAALYPDLSAAGPRVARITLRKAGADTVLERRGETWVVAGKGGYPADPDKVFALLRGLASARIMEPRTAKPDLYARLGVEDPEAAEATSTLVRLDDAGTPATSLAAVIVGKRDAAPSESPRFFARRFGENQAYLVEGDLTPSHAPLDWVVKNIAEIRNERVREVIVRQPSIEPLRISRTRAEEQTFALDGLPEGREPRDEYVLTRLAWALSFITFDDVAPAATIDTGVDGAGVTEFRGFDGLLITVRHVQKDGKDWISLVAGFEAPPALPPAEEEAAPAPVTAPTPELKAEIEALNAKWGPWVFQIPDYKATVLGTKMEDLLKPVAVNEENAEEAPAGMP